MGWQQRLKALVEDSEKMGRIRLKLLQETEEFRTDVFDDNDEAVQASPLGLIESAAESPPRKKSKSLREAPQRIQQFVSSARQNFVAYEHKKSLAVSGDSQEKNEFLAACGDLLGNFSEGGLIWIRKCYED